MSSLQAILPILFNLFCSSNRQNTIPRTTRNLKGLKAADIGHSLFHLHDFNVTHGANHIGEWRNIPFF